MTCNVSGCAGFNPAQRCGLSTPPHILELVSNVLGGKFERSFWSIRQYTGYSGFYEKQMLGDWAERSISCPDYVASRFRTEFRMSEESFKLLWEKYGPYVCKQSNNMRESIGGKKRMMIALSWLCSASPLHVLAAQYDVSKTVVHMIVHDFIEVMAKHLVPSEVVFPQGDELNQTMVDFEALRGLPQCAGAMDGTFFVMKKPETWGDCYWCYKKCIAIIVFAVVDARGRFTYVNAGQPGSAGDGATWNGCGLKAQIEAGVLLPNEGQTRVSGSRVGPFLVADSAFALSRKVMKCYEKPHPTDEEFNLNYAVIRTRRVVECAFGRLLGGCHLGPDLAPPRKIRLPETHAVEAQENPSAA